MKKSLLVVFLLYCNNTCAQNYKCVQADTINYFTNSDHYLRAIRIDSVKEINGDTILYPFKTARGQAYGNNKPALRPGGSWLGESITILKDRTHWFKNYNGDTVIIKALAGLNKKWILYNDTGSIYYEATLTSVDTMSVLGVLDSIKTIIISARNQQGIVTTDSFHNRKIVLSKNHGFVQVFDLYTFPQTNKFSPNEDYFSNKAGSLDFRISDFYNPDNLEIYDFQPGDQFQTHGITSSEHIASYALYNILTRTSLSNGTVLYNTRRVRHNRLKKPNYPTETFIDTITLNYHTGHLINLSFLPEEWGMTKFIKYNSNDTAFCFSNRYYFTTENFIDYQRDSALVNTFEPCGGGLTNAYKSGMGQLSYALCIEPTGFNPYWSIKYINKAGIVCGGFYNMAVIDSKQPYKQLQIYPNPANDFVNVTIKEYSLSYKIRLYDITGRLKLQKKLESEHAKLDVHKLADGYYVLSVEFENGSVSNNKVIIQH